jgi:hypothetical protein
MMRIHLNQVVGLATDQLVGVATDQLEGRYPDAIRLYDVYIGHIIDMGDMLSDGIIAQLPAQFR